MPKATNIPDEVEELSRLLDEMNCGRQPKSDNQETAELLAIADFIKKAEIPAKPPQHIIDQTVDKVMDDLVKNNTKRRHTWLHSGALGTAAAVLLVIGLNITTLWSDKQLAVVLPPVNNPSVQGLSPDKTEEPPHRLEVIPSPASPQETATPQTIATNITPAPATPPAAISKSSVTKTEPSASANKSAPAKAEQPVDAAKSAPTKAVRSITVKEQLLTKNLQKSVAIPEQDPTPPLTVLTLPGKVPDSVITDNEGGIIRQIYAKGTPQELIITQQALNPSIENTYGKANIYTTSDVIKDTKQAEGINKVTVTVQGQQVTLEGRQSEQELLKLAQTLTL